jgi:hypothetical protein
VEGRRLHLVTDSLAGILDRATLWTVMDAAGEPVGQPFANLRLALDAAQDGQTISRRSGAAIEVTVAQVTALKKMIAPAS